MPATIGLVLDCADAPKLAEFWAPALNFVNVWSGGTYVLLMDPSNVEPRLILQQVDEPKSAKNRLHFDLHPPDVDAEVARLEALGAQRGEEITEHATRWVVMTDPEGNEFCVCSAPTE
ncbi:MAG: VOC family protein [Actinobacteria bacterium]|nr:VOC family protein [Actinomycetota bacterium]